jgi:phthiodiolone/phenolphthiodiolone dimycocerosates ketoreductase
VKFRLAAFLRTTLPLDLSSLARMDGGRYHSIWLPDHMVSFWPDAIWTPEFTDLATMSHSPHRQLDGLAVAAAVGAMTSNAQVATSVIDTVRRHPALLAQTALTISHLSQGRFILGIGAGERENCAPYGFSVEKSVSRFDEALKVIRLLWDSTGPVDFEGQFYHLEHARLDTEAYGDRTPPIWIGASGPRMLGIAGKYGDGWWPAGLYSPEEYAAKLGTLRQAANEAGRQAEDIVPAYMIACLLGEPDEVREIVRQPMVKAFALQLTGESFRRNGFSHPLGDGWRGILDLEPDKFSREDLLSFIDEVDEQAILSLVPHGTPAQVVRSVREYADAGVRVATIIDYGGMAGLRFAEGSAARLRQLEDLILQHLGELG